MTPSHTPTMKDVAAKAGVSLGTVSKVINHITVGEKNRVKVEKAIKELGYEVNTYARGLKTQETKLITLIVRSGYYESFLCSLHPVCRADPLRARI